MPAACVSSWDDGFSQRLQTLISELERKRAEGWKLRLLEQMEKEVHLAAKWELADVSNELDLLYAGMGILHVEQSLRCLHAEQMLCASDTQDCRPELYFDEIISYLNMEGEAPDRSCCLSPEDRAELGALISRRLGELKNAQRERRDLITQKTQLVRALEQVVEEYSPSRWAPTKSHRFRAEPSKCDG